MTLANCPCGLPVSSAFGCRHYGVFPGRHRRHSICCSYMIRNDSKDPPALLDLVPLEERDPASIYGRPR
ncbi:MAG TPA: hypothetical protein VGV64_07780 [Thermoplasmata archaeon]|nr:hypothetical protein [Thermoplasmata archaeon]HEV2429722.1 hypothetical protein [Thermoplasmata archaeon]